MQHTVLDRERLEVSMAFRKKFHHGELLKNYIIDHKINRKGGINRLAEVLGLTRQAIYLLYQEKVILEKHRIKIIKHLELPQAFFPEIEYIPCQERYYNLMEKYIRLQEKYDALKSTVFGTEE